MPDCPELESKIIDHIDDDDRRFGEYKERFNEIKNGLFDIKDNHLAHIEPDISAIKAEIGLLRWGLLAILAGVIGNFFK